MPSTRSGKACQRALESSVLPPEGIIEFGVVTFLPSGEKDVRSDQCCLQTPSLGAAAPLRELSMLTAGLRKPFETEAYLQKNEADRLTWASYHEFQ